jgi:hypothetical protein
MAGIFAGGLAQVARSGPMGNAMANPMSNPMANAFAPEPNPPSPRARPVRGPGGDPVWGRLSFPPPPPPLFSLPPPPPGQRGLESRPPWRRGGGGCRGGGGVGWAGCWVWGLSPLGCGGGFWGLSKGWGLGDAGMVSF